MFCAWRLSKMVFNLNYKKKIIEEMEEMCTNNKIEMEEKEKQINNLKEIIIILQTQKKKNEQLINNLKESNNENFYRSFDILNNYTKKMIKQKLNSFSPPLQRKSLVDLHPSSSPPTPLFFSLIDHPKLIGI